MLNPDETVIQIKKYLKKLLLTINNDATLTLINVKIINKKKIDDILCCIEATFPDEYRDFIRKNGVKRLKTATVYQQLIASIRRKVWFDSASYDVLYKDAIDCINALLSIVESDMRKVYTIESSMF